MEETNITGERIRLTRILRNMTQDELASKLGYQSRVSIARIESGDTKVSLARLQQIADALEVDRLYLIGMKDDPDFNTYTLRNGKRVHIAETRREEPKARNLTSVEEDMVLFAYRKSTDDEKKRIQQYLGIKQMIDKMRGE